MPLLALGGSDCEALHDGWLGQPVNALSSLAYVAAGVYVLHRSRPPALGLAVALSAVGIGSFLYHGPMPRGAELVHDGSIVALAGAAVLTWRRDHFRRPPTSAPVVGVAAIAANLLTRTGAPLCRPASLLQGHAAWHVLTAAAIALWFTARPDPDPEPGAPGAPDAGGHRPRGGGRRRDPDQGWRGRS